MARQFFSRKNLDFLLYDVFDLESLTRHPYFSSHNRKAFDMIIDAAARLAKERLLPLLEEMDRVPPVFENGRVLVHPAVAKLMAEYGEGGWIGASLPAGHGGEQLPDILTNSCRFVFAAANYSASIFPELTAGAAHLIVSFGSPELRATYVPRMLSGEWQGTMALTEPQAGSSLTDITTTAFPHEDGTYRLRGQKVFISAGDHDGVENVVHLMLARIEGAPSGVKGISLFVVPRLRPAENGELCENDVFVSQIFHKMGYRGAPITELAIGEKGDCHGYLVGEANKGLFYMFQMMNEARVGVGIGAAAIATAAYYAALEYAQSRPQGRKIGEKDPSQPQVPIIEHADVKRMLLFQRAVTEGSLALLLQCSLFSDRMRTSEGDEKEACSLLLDLLTPVAKSFPSETGILSTSAAIQCFGGYGYCEDFPVEQYYRDIRIHPIHEGTTGIQAMDLLGRKVVMKNGRALVLYLEMVRKAIGRAKAIEAMVADARHLEEALQLLESTTWHLVGVASERGPEIFLADACLYLEMFGIVAVAWQWLLQAMAAGKALETRQSSRNKNFYRGKQFAFQYFYRYELPKIKGLSARLTDGDALTVEMPAACFRD
jgi:alkylation response protein AidB-like acyl-CoA dehydrogenase